MTVYALDPLHDSRWAELVDRHPRASVFHTAAWLRVLHQTYGYTPIAFTTSEPNSVLEDGVVVCQVRSWLTGRRLVSVPFADHCEPLAGRADGLLALLTHLDRVRRADAWQYVELRPRTDCCATVSGLIGAEQFWFHALDLQAGEQRLFAALHKDSIQRKIRRAIREGIAYEEGRTERLLAEFYELLQMTRHRHQLPPQPAAWFRNLIGAFGDSLKIRVARHGDRAIAAILTIRHRDVMVYKYGGSDATCHPLGGMHLLLWNTIQDGCANGCRTLDLGRSDLDNEGLATFKDRWGAARSQIAYQRFAPAPSPAAPLRKYAMGSARRLLEHAPHVCRVAAGRFLYRHAG